MKSITHRVSSSNEGRGRVPTLVGSGLCPVPESNYTLPQAYATFLESFNPWSWYFHFTSRDDTHPEAFLKRFKRWSHNLNREIFGVRYYKRGEGITYALGLEYQSRSVIHAHGIAGRIPDTVRRFDYMDMWDELSGFARIYPYEKDRGAEYYMSKSTYAWKHGEIELSSTLKANSNFRQLGLNR